MTKGKRLLQNRLTLTLLAISKLSRVGMIPKLCLLIDTNIKKLLKEKYYKWFTYNFSRNIEVDSMRNGDFGSKSFSLSTISLISRDNLLYLELEKNTNLEIFLVIFKLIYVLLCIVFSLLNVKFFHYFDLM